VEWSGTRRSASRLLNSPAARSCSRASATAGPLPVEVPVTPSEMQSGVFSFSKAIDTFCPIGPWIVTKDEVPDVQLLAMELRVNGEVRQQGNTAQMLISIPHLVAHHSAQGYSAGGPTRARSCAAGFTRRWKTPSELLCSAGGAPAAEAAGEDAVRDVLGPVLARFQSPLTGVVTMENTFRWVAANRPSLALRAVPVGAGFVGACPYHLSTRMARSVFHRLGIPSP
jgi:Fumarylacetoacetate (FAA) hydrolase family